MSAPAIISSGTASGGPPVGGSGTSSPSTIPRWTGPTTLGDSAITDNGTVVAFGRNINATSTAGGASYVLTPSAGGQVFGQTVASSVWYLGRTTGAGAAVQADVCINNSGNVGIGTASPAAKVHSVVADGVTYSYGASGTTKGFRVEHSATETRIVGVDNTLNASYQPLVLAGSTLGFNTNGSARAVTIDASQNVGIGTASPQARLHVGAGTDTPGIAATTIYASNAGVTAITARDSTNDVEAYLSAGTAGAIVGTYTSHPLAIRTGNIDRITVSVLGNVSVTSGTTGMTDGFLYISAAAGAPTGTPTAVSGRVPMYYDTTNNKFYVYNGAWKAVTLA